jgi:predicted MFS family arabinose efflux permease
MLEKPLAWKPQQRQPPGLNWLPQRCQSKIIVMIITIIIMTWGMILNFAMLSWLPQLCQGHGHDHHDLTMIVNQVPDCLGEDHD